MKISNLESIVLEWFSKNAGSEELRRQLESVRVFSRKHTGPGLIVALSTDNALSKVAFGCTPNSPLIKSKELAHGGGVDLWILDGVIAELEFVAFGGAKFPVGEFGFELVSEL